MHQTYIPTTTTSTIYDCASKLFLLQHIGLEDHCRSLPTEILYSICLAV